LWRRITDALETWGRPKGVLMTVDERIETLAACQHGLVTRAQLHDAGLTPRMVRHRLAVKRLRAVHRGVYRVGPLLSPRAREMAAVLAVRARAFVSHESVAALYEVRARRGDGEPVDLVVDEGVVVRRPGIRAHRASHLPDGDLTILDGIPVTTPLRMVMDLATVLGARDLERTLARVERRRLVTLDQVAERVARLRGHPGIATLARLVGHEGRLPFLRSEFEERFANALLEYMLPTPRFNYRVGDYELDCYWPDAQVGVELDGAAFHASWHSKEADRRRDRRLAAAGIQVIRITWEQLTLETTATMMDLDRTIAIRLDRAGRLAPG
jgi:very-short-patch-repair endonuclease